MKDYSPSWKSSTKPQKQRKYQWNAPLHVQRRFLSTHLSKPLRQKHKMRSAIIRVGDKVRIARGSFRGKTGTVERVVCTQKKVYLTGIDQPKMDGGRALYPIHPSNLVIEELNLQDKGRFGKPKPNLKKEGITVSTSKKGGNQKVSESKS